MKRGIFKSNNLTNRDLILNNCFTSKTITELSKDTRIPIEYLATMLDKLLSDGLIKSHKFPFATRYYRASKITL